MTKIYVRIIIILNFIYVNSLEKFMLFSRKDLFKIIWPLLIQQVFVVSIGMLDSVMVSGAGEAVVSGVSLVTTLDVMLAYIFLAFSSGGAVVVSQVMGQRNNERACAVAKQLFYAVTAVATLVTVTVVSFRYPLLNALFGDAEESVLSSAQDYFLYTALSFPFYGASEAISATFRAMGNSMVSLKVSLFTNIIKLGLNALFLYVFELGAMGAALATLISRVIGVSIMLVLIHNKRLPVHLSRLFKYRPEWNTIKSIMGIGVPGGIENGMFQFGKVMVQSLVSGLGTVNIAANAVANSLVNLQYIPVNALGAATIAVVGRSIGAGEKEQAKRYSRIMLLVNYASLLVVVLIMCIFLKPLVGLYNLSDASSSLARQLVLMHGLFAIFVHPIGFLLPSVFRAASDVRLPLIVSAVSMWTIRVGFGYIMTLESLTLFKGAVTIGGFGLGIKGLWIAMMIDWIVRTLIYGTHYLRGRWLKRVAGG